VAGDFKLAGAYVEVNLRDNTSGDEKRIRARIEGESAVTWDTALNDPKNTEIVKQKVSSGKPVQISADLDDKLAQAKADEFVAKRRSVVIDLDANIAKLRMKLEELNKKRGTSVEVDADIRKAEAELAALVTRRRTVQLEVQAKTRPAEDEISRMAARANAQFDALKFAGLSVGLPAAAAIGAAGVAGSLALVAGGFGALGVYIASTDEDIAKKSTALSEQVQTDAKAMGGSYKTEVSGALDDVGAAWGRLRPQVAAAVDASAPAVRILTGAVTDLAENAMPGLVDAAKASGPALLGVRAFAAQAGSGLSEFFTNASQGSAGAEQGFTLLGGVVQLLLGRFGTLFANLASGSAGPLNSLYAIVDDITGGLVDLTAQGSGAIGFLTGFTGTATGAAATLRLLLGVLSALPPEVTQLGGSVAASSLLLSKFGIDAGKGFEGFGEKVSSAKGATGKFSAVVSGLAASAFNPAALGAVALGVGLDILGQKQQEAAANTAAHAERERNLTEALRDSGGAITDNIRSLAVQDLGNYKVADGVRNLNKDVLNLAGPQGLQQLQDMYLGNTQAGDKLKATLDAQVEAGRRVATGFEAARAPFDDHIRYVNGVAYAYDDTGFKAQQLLDIVDSEGGTFGNASKDADANAQALKGVSKAAEQITPQAYAAKVATADLQGAFQTLNNTAGDTVSKGQAIIDVMDRLSGKHKSEEEALQSWNDHLRGIGDAFKTLDLAKHTKDLIDSSGAINTTSEAGSKLQDTLQQGATDMASYAQSLKDGGASAGEITDKLGPMRDEFAKQLKQLGLNDGQVQDLLKHYGLVPSDITTTMGLEGDADTQKAITDIVSGLAKVPANVGVKVQALTAEAQKNLTDLGYHVVNLPDGTVQVFANTTEGQHAADVLQANINQTHGTVSVYGDTTPAGSAVANWQTVTNRTIGNTLVTTDIDPATRQVRQWEQTTDETGAVTTTFSTVDPATGAVQQWKRNTDGTWATVNVNADTGGAISAIRQITGTRYSATVYVTANTSAIGGIEIRSAKYNALGNLYGPNMGFADGGFPTPTAANSFNGLAQIVNPGTYKWAGDAKVPEVFIPLDRGSERSQGLLDKANQLMGRATTASGATIANHITINTTEADPQRVAAAVSGELGWAMRGV
jgi:hypothetical protein